MAKYILIVDDAPNIVLSLEFLMKKEGYEVHSVSSGDEAMRAITEKIPDLILLDVMMPRKDGYEVCQELRANIRSTADKDLHKLQAEWQAAMAKTHERLDQIQADLHRTQSEGGDAG